MLVSNQRTLLAIFTVACTVISIRLSRLSTRGTAGRTMFAHDRGSVRFVIVSDTHRIYDRELPPGDVFVHAGDSELTAREMSDWVKSLPHQNKIIICGNMDYQLKHGKDSLEGVTYLQDSAVNISGLTIYGSPWTPEFTGVFQLENDDSGRAIWDKMPGEVDVLLTHGPPKGILDRTSRGMRVGDGELLKRVQEVKPRVHCFGHIHESYGTKMVGETLFCNGAVFNGHAPLVIDVPTDKSKPASVA